MHLTNNLNKSFNKIVIPLNFTPENNHIYIFEDCNRKSVENDFENIHDIEIFT